MLDQIVHATAWVLEAGVLGAAAGWVEAARPATFTGLPGIRRQPAKRGRHARSRPARRRRTGMWKRIADRWLRPADDGPRPARALSLEILAQAIDVARTAGAQPWDTAPYSLPAGVFLEVRHG